MGVYIKGMELPKDCPMCPLAHWDAADNFTGCNIVCGKKYAMSDKEYADSNTRPDWCPLVFVPPHGDLVDRKKLIDSFSPADFWYRTCEENCSSAVQVVNCAPTIIPAEEAEK